MDNSQSFRARSSFVFAGCGALLCGVALWAGIVVGGTKNIIATIFWVCGAITFLHLSFIRPKLEINNSGILITNPVLRAQLGWADVVDLGAKWNLYVRTNERVFNVWAAPAPGRRHNRKVHISEVRGMKSAGNEYISPAVSPRSESGIALHLAESAWNDFQNNSNASSLASEITRDWRGVILMCAFVLAALLCTLI
jgi:hypothetical protein